MAKQTSEQKQIVERVMHEFKCGELDSAGGRVRNQRQAIAIGLSEAGASNRETAKENRHNLERTRRGRMGAKKRDAQAGGNSGPTRAELYADAARRDIPGRSRMTKAQLEKVLER